MARKSTTVAAAAPVVNKVVDLPTTEKRGPGRRAGESVNKVISARRRMLAPVKLAVMEYLLPSDLVASAKDRNDLVAKAAEIWSPEIRALARKATETMQALADEDPADHGDDADDC